MNQFKRILSIILTGSLLTGSAAGMMDKGMFNGPKQFYGNHTTGVHRALGLAGAIAALYAANKFMNNKIERAFSKGAAELRHRWEQLDNLEERFNNTPFETFRQVADEKITDLTNKIDAYTANKIALLNAEFNKIVAERKRVEIELQKSRDLLRQVEMFMQSVRDRNGDAFLRQIIQTKHEVEDSYLRLQHTKNQLEQELTSLASRAAAQTGEVGRVEMRTDQLRNSVRTLERFVASQEDLATKTRNAEQRAAHLIDAANRADKRLREVNMVNNSFDRLRTEATRLEGKANDIQRRLDAVPEPAATPARPLAYAPHYNNQQPAAPRHYQNPAPHSNNPAPSAPAWSEEEDPF